MCVLRLLDSCFQDLKPPKVSKEKAGTSKVAPAKKPKSRQTAGTGSGEEPPPAGQPKAAKTATAATAAPRKTAKKASDAPAAKTAGKRGKKAAQ